MGSQPGYQSEADISLHSMQGTYCKSIMQIEGLLREGRKDTMSLWDKKSKHANIMLLEKEGSLRDG